MEWESSYPVVFRVQNREDAGVEVDIVVIDGNALAYSHAGDRQQWDQCLVRQGVDRLPQAARCNYELRDVVVRIEVRHRSLGWTPE